MADEISEKTKIMVPVGSVWAGLGALAVMFFSSYYNLYATVYEMKNERKIDCLVIQNIQSHTVPEKKQIKRECE